MHTMWGGPSEEMLHAVRDLARRLAMQQDLHLALGGCVVLLPRYGIYAYELRHTTQRAPVLPKFATAWRAAWHRIPRDVTWSILAFWNVCPPIAEGISGPFITVERSLPMFEAEARERRGKRTDLEPPGKNSGKSDDGDARDHAAKVVGVNPRYVSDAKRIRREAPKVAEQAEKGALTMSQAKQLVSGSPLPPPPSRSAVERRLQQEFDQKCFEALQDMLDERRASQKTNAASPHRRRSSE